jgi:lipopolysaccharide export system permease protein
MIRIHDRYLARSFGFSLGVAIVAFVAIFVVVDLFEKIDNYIDRKATAEAVVLYSAFKIPQIVMLVLPVAMLLACLFGVGSLARRNEVLPLQNAGLSMNRILLPVFAFGLVVSLAALVAGETILPGANARQNRVWKETILHEPRSDVGFRTNLNYRGEGGRLYFIGRFDPKRKTMHDVAVYTLLMVRGASLVERVDAREARWTDEGWVFLDGFRRRFGESDEEATPFEQTTIPGLKERPEDFAAPAKEPDEMSLRELRRFVRKTLASGESAVKEQVQMHLKLSFPFSNLIVVLFGASIAARRRRSGLAVSFAVAVGVAFLYYGAIRVGETLGTNDTLPPLLAAWLGNIIFGSAAVFVLVKNAR